MLHNIDVISFSFLTRGQEQSMVFPGICFRMFTIKMKSGRESCIIVSLCSFDLFQINVGEPEDDFANTFNHHLTIKFLKTFKSFIRRDLN